MEKTKKAWINGLFLAVTLVINTLGALGFINGLSQKEISDMFAPNAEINKIYPPEEWFIEAGNPPVKAWG